MKIIQQKLVIFLVVLTSFNSCNTDLKGHAKNSNCISDKSYNTNITDKKTTIKLDFGFIATVGQEENFQTFKTYTYFDLTRDTKTIYVDSALTEYEFGNKLYPIVLQTGKNRYELLFEINDRPSKNYIKRITIDDDQVVKQDKLPTFLSKPTDINNDGVKDYAGFWDYSQVWGENNDLTAYNPILYYSITKTGLQLDSLLTKERNKKIYGKFYGFSFSEKYQQPISATKKFDEEIKLITK
jgi:hypothetical protein